VAHTADATAVPFDMDGTHTFESAHTTLTYAQQLAHQRMKARSLVG
jgi:hypothetical protein